MRPSPDVHPTPSPALRWPNTASAWLVGFSHGPDSTLLLALAAEERARRGASPPVAVHVDHGWRAEGAIEAELARSLAARLEVPFVLERAPTGSRPGETRGRALRHAAFARVAARHDAAALPPPVVLLGQHHDDQRETVLFRLLRGSGPLGLAGMRAEHTLRAPPLHLARPLLHWTRAAIRAELERRGLPFVLDPSNAEPGLTPRNRLRHELLPAWRRRDPELCALDALQREADALRRVVDAELGLAGAALRSPLRLPLELLGAVSPWTAETLYARAIRALGHPPPPRRHLARIAALLARTPGRRVEARGRWRALRTREDIRFIAW